MQEIYTKGWVLERLPSGEADETVVCYTQDYGMVRAAAKSIRKITSKLSSQLQPLTFSKIRLVRRNGPKEGFRMVDALIDDSFPNISLDKKVQLLPIAKLLVEMTHEWEVDSKLWEYIEKINTVDISEKEMNLHILTLLGFDATHAGCLFCHRTPVIAFSKKRLDFVCAQCASKVYESELVWIDISH